LGILQHGAEPKQREENFSSGFKDLKKINNTTLDTIHNPFIFLSRSHEIELSSIREREVT
jgi:hypothetical protein